MRRFLRRLTVGLWLVWASRRRGRDEERGSQSLEWVGLGFVVMAIMATAYDAVAHGGLGASVGQALANFIKSHIAQ